MKPNQTVRFGFQDVNSEPEFKVNNFFLFIYRQLGRAASQGFVHKKRQIFLASPAIDLSMHQVLCLHFLCQMTGYNF